MALNWNIEKCKNYKQLTTEKEWNVTNSLIWATMAVQIGDLTAKNADEFYRRLHIIEQEGTFLNRAGKPYFITLADVKKRIGLSTNVNNSSRKDFEAHREKIALRKAKQKAPAIS